MYPDTAATTSMVNEWWRGEKEKVSRARRGEEQGHEGRNGVIQVGGWGSNAGLMREGEEG
jgi:hypothetical protein